MYNFWTVTVLRVVTLFFICAVGLAMFFYPGGNIHEPAQSGYSLTHNFLSDLGGLLSRSGEPNIISAVLFNTAMILFLGVGIGFLFASKLFQKSRIDYVLATVGSMCFFFGTIFFAGVGLTPHDLLQETHVFFALNAFRLLIPGAFAYLIVLLRSPVENKYALVTMVYLICTFAYVIYQMVDGSPLDSAQEMIEQATIQKLIALVSVGTIFSLSFAFSSQLKRVGLR
tara:strand:- start:2082 stop:2762 length:681 start_codon:yes stop_codon:yes gene_type:complete